MELIVHSGERIISKTDRKGMITACNDYFLKYSEYSEAELIGKPHNIIRHYDMPKIVFRLLWVKLHYNMEVNVFVKNRTKNGNFYWVYATVSPITDFRTGEKKGYISIRKAPNREAIELIEPFYAELMSLEKERGDAKAHLKSFLEQSGMKFCSLMSRLQAQGRPDS